MGSREDPPPRGPPRPPGRPGQPSLLADLVVSAMSRRSLLCPAVFKDGFDFCLVPPHLRGVTKEGPDCRFPSETVVLGRIRGGGSECQLVFVFDRKFSWVAILCYAKLPVFGQSWAQEPAQRPRLEKRNIHQRK